ncbi:hypothetical protein M2M59_06985 [Rummeliibacillus sp. G93]|uniref:Uncharacterized protein n=2 Tax=Rummeliibacillus stabekisii TaxID=241244 RepID=A0A143HBQ0_9BACL|nr:MULTISPECIES: hypothetical protein [Rummeliibacillus]AMW98839.1 hypothetical protein ATY39_04885 [Rummeliibacillus stabekisii]MBB5169489.1 peptidoglycan/LPS O-acetylase OafA/YrhL [Rummeliibacillus stabekisii]MCM3316245.1 hypothetical protein [Rummeliibacillus stabekisii]UQW98752.1 hypothetical protein M2M59_06985 [Rummeliibacillus sp. G93]
MEFLFYVLMTFLFLIGIRIVIPTMHQFFAVVLFFILLSFLMMRVVLPFWQKLKTFFLFDLPYMPLILGSSLLYLCSLIVSHILDENDYESIAFISHLAIKIWIVTLWLDELASFLKQWEKLVAP